MIRTRGGRRGRELNSECCISRKQGKTREHSSKMRGGLQECKDEGGEEGGGER